MTISPQRADAILTYCIYESGLNVVVETGGSLNLPSSGGNFSCGANGTLISSIGVICTGSNASIPRYFLSGPLSPLPGTANLPVASSVSGLSTLLDVSSNLGQPTDFAISGSYVNGTPIVSSATFNNQTLAGLGFVPGLVGSWTFINQPSESVRVFVGAPGSDTTQVPGPLPLMGAGAAFAISRRLRRRVALGRAVTPQA